MGQTATAKVKFSDRVFDHFCRVVTPTEPMEIQALPATEISDWLAHDGVLVFRGFQVSIEAFNSHTDRYRGELGLRPVGRINHRNQVRKRVQQVTSGEKDLQCHSEEQMGPWMPHLLWFYCEQPAPRGGETTLCDAVQVRDEVPPQTREWLDHTTFRFNYAYRHRRPLPRMKQVIGERMAQLQGFVGIDGRDGRWSVGPLERLLQVSGADEVEAVLAQFPNLSFRRAQDDSFYLDWRVPAARPTATGDARAVLNVFSDVFPPAWFPSLEDGGEVPPPIVREVRAATKKAAVEFPLQEGDVMMIDNTRFMHGRRAFSGPRKIYVSQAIRLGAA